MADTDYRTPGQKRRIRRMALALGALALAFFLGFITITSMSS